MKKVKIYTWADRRPDFIEKQYETLKHFIKDEEWEFIVFNNAPFFAFSRSRAIKKECSRLGLKCSDVRFRTFVNGPAQICAWGIDYMFQRFARWDRKHIHVILDSDMFFVNDFNFNEYLGENCVAALHHTSKKDESIEYLWNGFVIFDGEKLPDHSRFIFACGKNIGKASRTDVGGRLYYWLKNNPEAKVKRIKHTAYLNEISDKISILPERVRDSYNPDFGFQFIEAAILHYRAGSNWQKSSEDFVDKKSEYFNKLLGLVMSGEANLPSVNEHYQDYYKV